MTLKKKQKTKLLIMHTAKVLFEKNGLDNVTFAQIAEEADVCRTTVFNHFSCINELLAEIFLQEMKELQEYCESSDLEGLPLIKALFFKLFEDTAKYPAFSIRLTHNAVLYQCEKNPIIIIEDIVYEALVKENIEDAENLSGVITGLYFGLVNHYKIHNLIYDIKAMEKDFCMALSHLLGGNYYD